MEECYFSKMKETHSVIRPILENYLGTYKNFPGNLYSYLSKIPLGRKSSVRNFFLRQAYETVSNEDWEWIAPVGAAIEFHLASTYYTNLVFDEKGGKRTKQQDNVLIVSSCISRSLSSKCLYQLNRVLTPDILMHIYSLFSSLDAVFYSGQYLDIAVNTVYNDNLPETEIDLVDLYEKRTKQINSYFYEIIGTISSKLSNANKNEEAALVQFGKYYGIAQQIMDDINDFVPEIDGQSTVTKLPSDAHSDFKHGKLTLPIIHFMQHGDRDKLLNMLKRGNNLNTRELTEVTRMLIRTGSIDYAKKTARKYSDNAKEALKIFPKEKRKWLCLMCVAIDSNRYYKCIDKYRDI